MGASGDVTGVEVDGLHGTGRKIAGRATGGQAAAKGLKDGLDSATSTVGHGRVKTALTTFVTNHVLDDSNLLGHQLTAGGDNVSNVASTARSSDEEAARALGVQVNGAQDGSTDLNNRINRIE